MQNCTFTNNNCTVLIQFVCGYSVNFIRQLPNSNFVQHEFKRSVHTGN